MKISEIFGYMLVVAFIVTVIIGMWVVIDKELDNQKVQGECIASYINAGVERRDIFLVGSTDCEVKK